MLATMNSQQSEKHDQIGSSGGLYNRGTGSGSRAARMMADAIESVMGERYFCEEQMSNTQYQSTPEMHDWQVLHCFSVMLE